MDLFFKTLNFTLPMNKTYVMGILNVTPDSFSDGNKYFDKEVAVDRALEMVEQGADIIDVGGQSTRPGHVEVSEEEEWDRLRSVISSIRSKVDVPISVDTFYPSVAERALRDGADIINDVSGFLNESMFEIARRTSCGCVIMCDGSLDRLPHFFSETLKKCRDNEIKMDHVCFDPGVGFGKTQEENLKILRDAKKYCPEGYPILIGASRKRVIGNCCNNPPFEERLAGTIAAHTLSVVGGANIIRVHDVAEAVQAAKVSDAILKDGSIV